MSQDPSIVTAANDFHTPEDISEATVIEAVAGLTPAMRGTEKQAKWGRCIRARRYCEAAAEMDNPEELAAFVAFAQVQTAKFWINTRRLKGSEFIRYHRDKHGVKTA